MNKEMKSHQKVKCGDWGTAEIKIPERCKMVMDRLSPDLAVRRQLGDISDPELFMLVHPNCRCKPCDEYIECYRWFEMELRAGVWNPKKQQRNLNS